MLVDTEMLAFNISNGFEDFHFFVCQFVVGHKYRFRRNQDLFRILLLDIILKLSDSLNVL